MFRRDFLAIVKKEHKFLEQAASIEGADNATEVVNDVLMRLLETKAYLDIDPRKGSVRGYVYCCVRSHAKNIIRRQLFEGTLFEALDYEQKQYWEPDMAARVDIRNAVAALPRLERTVAEQVYMSGASLEELAAELAVPLIEVREAARRCREKLRYQLADYRQKKVG